MSMAELFRVRRTGTDMWVGQSCCTYAFREATRGKFKVYEGPPVGESFWWSREKGAKVWSSLKRLLTTVEMGTDGEPVIGLEVVFTDGSAQDLQSLRVAVSAPGAKAVMHCGGKTLLVVNIADLIAAGGVTGDRIKEEAQKLPPLDRPLGGSNDSGYCSAESSLVLLVSFNSHRNVGRSRRGY